MKPEKPPEKRPKLAVFDRERRFVDEYLIDFNAARAARDTGLGEPYAYSGYRYLQRARVQGFLKQARAEMSQRTKLTAEWLEKRYLLEALTAPTASGRLAALQRLERRLPDWSAPESVEFSDVTNMSAEQRIARRMALIAEALKRSKEK